MHGFFSKDWQLFISLWQKHLSKKYPWNGSQLSRVIPWSRTSVQGSSTEELMSSWPSKPCHFCEHILQFSSATQTANCKETANEQDFAQLPLWQTSKVSFNLWELWFQISLNALVFSGVQLTSPVSAVLAKRTFNCDFMLLLNYCSWFGSFGFHFFFTSDIGNKELQLIKRAHIVTQQYSRGNTGKLAPSYHQLNRIMKPLMLYRLIRPFRWIFCSLCLGP